MTNITVSLDTAKKMKKMGWEYKCHFAYEITGKEMTGQCFHWRAEDRSDGFIKESGESGYYINTPTAQEILNELPTNIGGYGMCMDNVGDGECCISYVDIKGRIKKSSMTDCLAETLAHMRMRCKEQGHLSDS